MDFTEFQNLIIERLKTHLGKDEIFIHTVMKNNGLKLHGVVVLDKDKRISPSIYLEGFYSDYKEGRGIDNIVDEILYLYNEQDGQVNFNPEIYKDIKQNKENIMFKLVNYEKNAELLECVPHRRLLDLAIVYFVVIICDDAGLGSVLVRNEHLNFWNITEEELHNIAKENTPKRFPVELRTLGSMVLDLLNKKEAPQEEYEDFFDMLANEELYDEDNDIIKMYVLTNNIHINGAGTLMYENIVQDFAKKKKKNVYVLPSSIHELILVPDDGRENMAKTLLGVVNDANTSCVSDEEWLSDNIYYYNYERNTIDLISNI